MNRFEEDFKELGMIYEAYFAKKAGGQQDVTQGSPSWNKGTAGMNPAQINQYAANSIPQSTSPVSDEEKEADPIITKLEELQKEAEDDGQTYAVHQLTTLKEFIANL